MNIDLIYLKEFYLNYDATIFGNELIFYTCVLENFMELIPEGKEINIKVRDTKCYVFLKKILTPDELEKFKEELL